MEHYRKAAKAGYLQSATGIRRKTLIYGERTLITEFLLEKGADLPMHSHPQEQTGYLVSGHMVLTIGENEYNILPGDAWLVPWDVTHGATILADSVAVEVFSPVREDYLP
jgi:quercetin dioxygenase-like cupin family protein